MPANETRRTVLLAATVAALLPLTLRAVEIVDDFAAGDWRHTNARAPGEVHTEKGRLVLTDHPGGEVTWGTSAGKVFHDVDIQATPYFVVEVAKMTGRFQVKLAGAAKEWPKKSVIVSGEPGLGVVHIPTATGWKPGKGRISVMLYTTGDGTQVEYRFVKFTDTLTAKEKEQLRRAEMEGPRKMAPHAGLTALASRRGAKPIGVDPAAGERSVYVDPVTGHEVWRMTDHPAIERHVYYDILAWNADGSTIMWLSRRAGGNYWLMAADGTNIRPLPAAADGSVVKSPHWSPSDPNVMYFARPEEDRVRVMTLDVRDGGVAEVTAVPIGMSEGQRKFSELPPPHLDGRHFLLRWGGQDRFPTMLAVVDASTGEHQRMDLPFPTHRVRFTKHSDLSVFVNSNTDPDKPGQRARSEWVVSLDGSVRRLPPGGGHPDWSPDGAWLGVFSSGGIWLISHDGQVRKQLVETKAGGHGGFSLTTGRWHVADAPGRGPYGNLVYVTELETGQVTPISYHGASYSGWGSGVPDPEATHPAPICSPDETKIMYDSDLIARPDVWVAVWKRPGAPRDVRFQDGRLSWKPPVMHREIARYNIYRKVDGCWTPFRSGVAELEAAGLETGQYAVASQEWSGLESRFAMAGGDG